MVFEMPLEKLKTYTGTNPCPSDFDEYWQAALEEMNSVDPNVQLVKEKSIEAPYAECYNLFYTGVKGARIRAQFIKPKRIKNSCPVIVRFHGYQREAGDWSDKFGLVAAGFIVVAMDVRGQNGLSEDVGGHKGNTVFGHIIRGLDGDKHNLLFRHVFLDTAQLIKILTTFPEVDKQRIATFGYSQGGGLALACAALSPDVSRVVSVYPFLSDYKRVWEMDLAKDAYEEIRMYFRFKDPTHEHEDEIFTKLGYIDVQHLAKWIKAEVLMVTGLMDTICPPSTQFAIYNKITSKKKMLIYPDFGHEQIFYLNDKIFMYFMEMLK